MKFRSDVFFSSRNESMVQFILTSPDEPIVSVEGLDLIFDAGFNGVGHTTGLPGNFPEVKSTTVVQDGDDALVRWIIPTVWTAALDSWYLWGSLTAVGKSGRKATLQWNHILTRLR